MNQASIPKPEQWQECKQWLQTRVPGVLYQSFIEPLEARIGPANEILIRGAGSLRSQQHIHSRYLPLIREFYEQRNNYQVIALSGDVVDSFNGAKTTAFVSEPAQLASGMEGKDRLSQPSAAAVPVFYPANENRCWLEQRLAMPGAPVILMGPSGSGKTHLARLLLQARDHAGIAACYYNMESFLSEFALACKKRDTVQWRTNLRHNHTIILDDFHYLKSGALRAAEELHHLIDFWHDQNRELILLSAVQAAQLVLPDQLQSRLLGLPALQLQYPDLEGRLQILSTALTDLACPLTPETMQYICQRIPFDMRLLKAAAQRMQLWQLQHGRDSAPHHEALQISLGDLFARRRKAESGDVLAAVSRTLGVAIDVIQGPVRTRRASLARHLVAWICHTELKIPQKDVALVMGRNDHGSVIHACKKIENLLQKDLFFGNQVALIKKELFQY
ncbi:MAG: ATP-binding protein [Leptospiraceae bacterium]|nr:ATP-binding protein [Leptospiraceae bacterium]